MKGKLLIIDDEEMFCEGLSEIINEQGYLVASASNGISALQMIKEKEYDLILLDINLPGESGIELIPEIKSLTMHTPIIMVTAYNDVSLAVSAIKAGAQDYCIKSSYYNELLIKIEKTLEILKLRKDIDKFQETLFREYNLDIFIGTDSKIKKVFNDIRKIARTKNTGVLITGESGTGKEMVAKYIHYLSDRKTYPFIAVNCGAIPAGICESEIFGYESGAFTDAKKEKKGVFELAEGGTLFLDEIGNMHLGLQPTLLRILEEKKFRRLGGIKDIDVDVRTLSASNKNPEMLAKEGKFREDLLYRLNTFTIELPPLRDRREDIIPLAHFFMEKYNKLLGKNFEEIDDNAKNILCNYNYPGNIRELKNTIERAVILGKGKKITPKHLAIITPSKSKLKDNVHDEEIKPLKEMEKEYILQVLNLCNGNKTEAARKLGISRSTLNLQLKQFKD